MADRVLYIADGLIAREERNPERSDPGQLRW